MSSSETLHYKLILIGANLFWNAIKWRSSGVRSQKIVRTCPHFSEVWKVRTNSTADDFNCGRFCLVLMFLPNIILSLCDHYLFNICGVFVCAYGVVACVCICLVSHWQIKIRPKIPSNWRIFESNWFDFVIQFIILLSISSQFDANVLHLDTQNQGRIFIPPVTKLFRSKWLHFSFSVGYVYACISFECVDFSRLWIQLIFYAYTVF